MNKLKELLNIFTGPFTLAQKLNYARYIFSVKKESLAYKPVILSVVATGKCTLSCDMCPTHSEIIPKDYKYIQKTTGDITFETFKKVVDRFPKAMTVSIIGSGEPLLNPDFFKIVEYAAKKYKMTVKTFTNGTKLKENIKKLINSPLDGITVSLNSHNGQDYKRLTGMDEAVYPNICDATKELISARNAASSPLKVKVSFIVDRENYVNINDMIEKAGLLGADTIFLCNFLPSPYKGFTPEERAIFFDDNDIRSYLETCKKNLSAELIKKVKWPLLISKSSSGFKCDCHFSQLRVDGEGNIGSCSMMLLNMDGNGNIDDPEVWNNDFFKKMRRNFMSGDVKKLDEQCIYCPDNSGVNF